MLICTLEKISKHGLHRIIDETDFLPLVLKLLN